MRIGDGWCASFAIVGYPREVGHGWLEPLTSTWSGRALAAIGIPALILLVVCLL